MAKYVYNSAVDDNFGSCYIVNNNKEGVYYCDKYETIVISKFYDNKTNGEFKMYYKSGNILAYGIYINNLR